MAPRASEPGVPASGPDFAAVALPGEPTVLAPDGSEVRVLAGVAAGSMAHFRLAPGQISAAVAHRTVEEIWYVVSGLGRMWRASATREEELDLRPGLSLTLPLGTRFQFRAAAHRPLEAVAVTMPRWPGADEAVLVAGRWAPGAAPEVQLAPADAHDAERLADLRVLAMRPSLERLGRFDPGRARARLLERFDAARTRHIVHMGERVGFLVLTPGAGQWVLDHLYVRPDAQGGGLGGAALLAVCREADEAGVALSLGALRESDSNRFYLRHGFVESHRTEFDVYYRRLPSRS